MIAAQNVPSSPHPPPVRGLPARAAGCDGGVSVTTLRLDRAQMQAARQAETEESRLALWRMDSLLTSIMVEESARPFSAWESFSRNEPALQRLMRRFNQGNPHAVTVAGLLVEQCAAAFPAQPGRAAPSPQLPLGAERTCLDEWGHDAGIQTAAARLNEYQSLLNLQCVEPPPDLALSPAQAGGLVLNRDILINGCAVVRTNSVGPITVPEPLLAQTDPPRGQRAFRRTADAQFATVAGVRSDNEWQARANFNQAVQLQAVTNAYGNQMPARAGSQGSSFANSLSSISPLRQTNASGALNVSARPPAALPVTDIAGEGVFKPLWVGSERVLARRVNFADRFVVQGVWLNRTNLRQSLVVSVKDLFPTAEILPVLSMNTDPQARLLASIPARLVTGPALLAEMPNWSPVRTALVVAWLCVLLAALAVAVLLHGTVSLSERRAAFVSAVTHELRTPSRRSKCIPRCWPKAWCRTKQSARAISRRLFGSQPPQPSRRNVLAYARLERGSAQPRERVSLGQLIDRVKPRLDQRAAQAEMQVVVDSTTRPSAPSSTSTLPPWSKPLQPCGQRLQYAAPTASEKLIHLEALPDGKFAMLRVRDHGQGISAEARAAFQPFISPPTKPRTPRPAWVSVLPCAVV
jgi:hypothetical protein